MARVWGGEIRVRDDSVVVGWRGARGGKEKPAEWRNADVVSILQRFYILSLRDCINSQFE